MDGHLVYPEYLPRRFRCMSGIKRPPAILNYYTTYLSASHRLLASGDELAREVQSSASPLGCFISASILTSSQHVPTEWTEERLRCTFGRAQQVHVCRDDLTVEFLVARYHTHYRQNEEDMGKWEWYKENQEYRHHWGQFLRCNFDWDWDLSFCMRRLFKQTKTQHPSVKLSLTPDGGWHLTFSANRVPETLEAEYRTETGEIRYRTFRADPPEKEFAVKCASNASVSLMASEEPAAGSSPVQDGHEYRNLLEYRELNRHARRKIKAWLNDGWRISWEWNWLHDYSWLDSRYNYNDPYRSTHWMNLKGPKPNLSSFTSNKITLKFPRTPKPLPDPNPEPGWDPVVYSDSDSDSG